MEIKQAITDIEMLQTTLRVHKQPRSEALDYAIKFLKMAQNCVDKNTVLSIVTTEFVDLQDGTDEWRSYVNETVGSIMDNIELLPTISERIERG